MTPSFGAGSFPRRAGESCGDLSSGRLSKFAGPMGPFDTFGRVNRPLAAR